MTLREYAEHVARMRPVAWVQGVPWMTAGRVMRPLAPPHRMGPVDRAAVRAAMRETGALLARWNDRWDTEPCPWWWVACDQPDYDLGQFSKKTRYAVRTGLKHCRVERIGVERFAREGYAVYAAAFRRYGTPPPMTAAQFAENARRDAEYPGRETWGAFVGESLVAYISCIVVDDVALLSSSKSDPDALRHKPNNALTYEVTRHYLRDRHCLYVTGGSRAVHHETQIQDFREKMGHRRIYCPLRLELTPVLRRALRVGLARWGPWLGLRWLAPGMAANLQAAARLAGIARACEALP